jgi:hypothetical protein
LNGRVLAQAAGTVTLNANTITGPTCAAAPSGSGSSGSSSGTGSGSGAGTGTGVGSPNTGFGVRSSHLRRDVTAYGFGVTGCFALAFVTRRAAKKQS